MRLCLSRFLQESLCTPAGFECYKNIQQDPTNCLIPCKGLYADVEKGEKILKVEDLRIFDSLIEDYKRYKSGYTKEIYYSNPLASKYINKQKQKIFKKYFYVDYKNQSELHFVHIFFATPTFDLITKDEKPNFVTKLSAIGGTMGLLTGFSLISAVEILYFFLKIVMNMIKICLENREICPSHIK